MRVKINLGGWRYFREGFSAGIFHVGRSNRVHWIEFREVYDRINKATGKAEKVVEGIVKYLNAKHQLVYGNNEYVDRFIIGDAAYARINEDVKMTDESVLVLLNSSAIYGDDWPFEDYDNNLLEIQDKAIIVGVAMQ